MVHLLPLVGINADIAGFSTLSQFLIHASTGCFMWVFTIGMIVALVEIYEKMLSYRKPTIISNSTEL